MADNFVANAGSGGSTFASDDISSVQYPRLKIVHGADGTNDGDPGQCAPGCLTIQTCGDAVVEGKEVCDDGTNLMSYDFNDEDGCAPGCQPPARCGDEQVDVAFGEQCDDGNDVDGDGCESNCTYREGCGDGNVDEDDGETFDDDNRKNGDGCSQFCTIEIPVIR